MVRRIHTVRKTVRIAIVGKYIRLHDAYLSIAEALAHAGFECGASVEIAWVESEEVTEANAADLLGACDGVLIPGGFGDRGIEGMVCACRYARERHIPYFGICLGMQISVIEFARHVLGLADANSREFTRSRRHLVIDFMPDQNNRIPKGGTMRLGAYPCRVLPGSVMHQAYGVPEIRERHRHRYEFNNRFRQAMEEAGLSVCGQSPDGRIVEAVELPAERFFVGVQFHPEFKSRPNRPHPLFTGLVGAALQNA